MIFAASYDGSQGLGLTTRPPQETDKRHKAFYTELGKGRASVEVDAVHPDTLRALVLEAIESHIAPALIAAVETEEHEVRDTLQRLAEYGR